VVFRDMSGCREAPGVCYRNDPRGDAFLPAMHPELAPLELIGEIPDINDIRRRL